jgi:sulfofructose kinase
VTVVHCVGIAVLDYVLTVDELPTGDGKYYASSYREVGGGVAANAAAAIAALGGQARLVSRVGRDQAGARIVEDLAGLGVDVGKVEAVDGVTSPVSAVLVDGAGERTIINHTPGALFREGDATDAADIDGADAVLVDVRWPDGAAGALQAASSAGIPAVFDFDRPMADGGSRLLTLADHIVFSREALAATGETDDVESALRAVQSRTDAWLAVTAGADGVWWLEDSGLRHQEAFPVEVVDTVGAGDVFHGAFTLALAEGSANMDAVRFAAAAAALKCSRPGGRAGTPSRSEVDDLIEGRS